MSVPKTVSTRIEKAAEKISVAIGVDWSPKRFWYGAANTLETLATLTEQMPVDSVVALAKRQAAALVDASQQLIGDAAFMGAVYGPAGLHAPEGGAAEKLSDIAASLGVPGIAPLGANIANDNGRTPQTRRPTLDDAGDPIPARRRAQRPVRSKTKPRA